MSAFLQVSPKTDNGTKIQISAKVNFYLVQDALNQKEVTGNLKLTPSQRGEGTQIKDALFKMNEGGCLDYKRYLLTQGSDL